MEYSRIILIGPMGAGKTSVGLQLANILGLQFIDSDAMLAQQLHKSVKDVYLQHGEKYFRKQECLQLEKLIQQENIVLATGGGSILDATLRSKLVCCGLICYLKVSPQQQTLRVQQCCHRPSVPVDVQKRMEFFNSIAIQRNHLYESISELQIDTDQLDVATIANRVMQYANRE